MDEDFADHLRDVERTLSRMRSEIRAQDIFIDLLLKAASASIDQNREAILTALWIAQSERLETNGPEDETVRILGQFSARLDTALARAPLKVARRA